MGFVRLHEENTRIEEIPFMSETKWMAVKTKRTWAFGHDQVIIGKIRIFKVCIFLPCINSSMHLQSSIFLFLKKDITDFFKDQETL